MQSPSHRNCLVTELGTIYQKQYKTHTRYHFLYQYQQQNIYMYDIHLVPLDHVTHDDMIKGNESLAA